MSWRDVACDLWPGAVSRDGYGRQYQGGRMRYAHVIAWEAAHGPVPDGFELDHRCRVRCCREPRHLRLVTHRTNVLLGEHPNVVAHRAGTCRRGHSASEFYRRRRGPRAGEVVYCRACRRERLVTDPPQKAPTGG